VEASKDRRDEEGTKVGKGPREQPPENNLEGKSGGQRRKKKIGKRPSLGRVGEYWNGSEGMDLLQCIESRDKLES